MLDLPVSGWPRLDAWLARCMERASVADTIAESRAALPLMANVGRLLETDGFRRQYRDHRLEWMIRAGGLDIVTNGLTRGNIRFTDLGSFAPSGGEMSAT